MCVIIGSSLPVGIVCRHSSYLRILLLLSVAVTAGLCVNMIDLDYSGVINLK